jgi:hypothetical protein
MEDQQQQQPIRRRRSSSRTITTMEDQQQQQPIRRRSPTYRGIACRHTLDTYPSILRLECPTVDITQNSDTFCIQVLPGMDIECNIVMQHSSKEKLKLQIFAATKESTAPSHHSHHCLMNFI